MKVTGADIKVYREINKLSDSINITDDLLKRVDKNCFDHRTKLYESKSEDIKKRAKLEVFMVKKLGPAWQARVVEHIAAKANVFPVLSRSAISGHNEKQDVDRIIFGEGENAFEIRRAVRGQDV